MITILYDRSFNGFLTVVFEVFERRLQDFNITGIAPSSQLFIEIMEVETDRLKAERVWKGLKNKLSSEAVRTFYYAFLSEIKDIENILLAYARYVFSTENGEMNFGNDAVLTVAQTAKKVGREKHRMEAFVRFRLTAGGLFYATIEPDYNVLPIITAHFKRRYADQNWLIYDLKRDYGVQYDMHTGGIMEINIKWNEKTISSDRNSDIYTPGEELYQLLWKDYFSSVNIPARKNIKLHIQHVPRRYWKHITEKQ